MRIGERMPEPVVHLYDCAFRRVGVALRTGSFMNQLLAPGEFFLITVGEELLLCDSYQEALDLLWEGK